MQGRGAGASGCIDGGGGLQIGVGEEDNVADACDARGQYDERRAETKALGNTGDDGRENRSEGVWRNCQELSIRGRETKILNDGRLNSERQ